ncbi:MAG TPA: polysaccharide deacetylase family protein [Pirellulales bacterium]|nr:polysaccharide deacetylase family protein [Pirellulales bacterium]
MHESLAFGPPIITADIEDWPQSTWDHSLPVTARAADNTRRLLDILAQAGVRATMFVLAKFAQAFPDVVRQIDAQGHEVGAHTWAHEEVFRKTPEQFLQNARRTKDLLEQITGKRVYGYRAADFSIIRDTLWGLDVLAEAGYAYDSSIFPVERPRYGIPDWPQSPRRVLLASGRSIVEFPIASYTALGRNWPVGGGGYHRLLPGWASRAFARRVMQSAPFVFYCHPYEFDPREFAEIPHPIPWKLRLHQGLGRSRFTARFVAFLRAFSGRRMVDALEERAWPDMDVQPFLRGTGGANSQSALAATIHKEA